MNESFEIGCPKCGSTQITADNKGYNAGKALAGAVLTGGIGLLAGFHGSKKVIITCLACGYKFKAGEGRKIYPSSENKTLINIAVPAKPKELNRIICPICKTHNFINFKYCLKCSKELSVNDEKIHSEQTFALQNCSSCNQLTPKQSLICVHCKSVQSSTASNTGCVLFSFVIFLCFTILLVTIFL